MALTATQTSLLRELNRPGVEMTWQQWGATSYYLSGSRMKVKASTIRVLAREGLIRTTSDRGGLSGDVFLTEKGRALCADLNQPQ